MGSRMQSGGSNCQVRSIHLYEEEHMSRSCEKSNSELMVLVTPRLVRGLDPDQVPEVDFPGPFLDTDKFDGRYGEVPNEAGRP